MLLSAYIELMSGTLSRSFRHLQGCDIRLAIGKMSCLSKYVCILVLGCPEIRLVETRVTPSVGVSVCDLHYLFAILF